MPWGLPCRCTGRSPEGPSAGKHASGPGRLDTARAPNVASALPCSLEPRFLGAGSERRRAKRRLVEHSVGEHGTAALLHRLRARRAMRVCAAGSKAHQRAKHAASIIPSAAGVHTPQHSIA